MRSIKEICLSKEVHQSEMEYVVEQYIKERKGVDVKIDITSGLPPISLIIQMQLKKLDKAFNIASKYFIQN